MTECGAFVIAIHTADQIWNADVTHLVILVRPILAQ